MQRMPRSGGACSATPEVNVYKDHVPIIAGAMRERFSVFQRGVMFAILSARVQFNRMPDQVADLDKRKEKASCLWSWKFQAYCELAEQGPDIWETLRYPRIEPEYALHQITKLHGLGLVKGAFVLQLMGYDVACLDSRNNAAEGRNPRAWRGPYPMAKCAAYVRETGGKAEYYWDRWCIEVGPDYGMTPDQCSHMHLDLIVPPRLRKLYYQPHKTEEIPF